MSRKKKNRKVFTNPLSSRNRGAVWGRNLTYFVLSVFSVSVKFLAAILIFIPKIGHWLWRCWRQRVESDSERKPTALSNGELKNSALDQFSPLAEKPNVSFADVVGLDSAKDLIHSRMILPFQFPNQARAYKVKKGGGLLLFGPKGTGKTTLAKAVASEIDAAFFHLKPSKLVRGEVGASERLVEDLFAALKRQPKAVLFFDEAEELTESRSASRSTIMKRLITQFLQEWDGLDSQTTNHALLVIGATNLPWQVDSAFIRPGRFDFLIHVGLPDLVSRRRLLSALLSGRPVADDLSLDLLAEKTEGYSGADIKGLVEEASALAFAESLNQKPGQTLPPIDLDDFLAALNKVRPSVNQDELKRYEEFRRRHQLL